MVLHPYTPQTKRELFQVHALLSSAPDRFYQVPNARPDELRTLESTIAELHRGVDHVFRRDRHEEARAKLHAVLDTIHDAFKSGHEDKGHALWDDLGVLLHETRP
jgi:hypothetical protein